MYYLSPCWSKTCKHRSAQTLNKEPSTAVGLIMYNCIASCRNLLLHILCTFYVYFEWNLLGYHPGIQKSERVGKNDLRACAVGSKGTGSFQRNTTWIKNTKPPGLKTHFWLLQGKSLHGSLFLQKQQVQSNLYFWSPSYNEPIGGFCFTIFQTASFMPFNHEKNQICHKPAELYSFSLPE